MLFTTLLECLHCWYILWIYLINLYIIFWILFFNASYVFLIMDRIYFSVFFLCVFWDALLFWVQPLHVPIYFLFDQFCYFFIQLIFFTPKRHYQGIFCICIYTVYYVIALVEMIVSPIVYRNPQLKLSLITNSFQWTFKYTNFKLMSQSS